MPCVVLLPLALLAVVAVPSIQITLAEPVLSLAVAAAVPPMPLLALLTVVTVLPMSLVAAAIAALSIRVVFAELVLL